MIYKLSEIKDDYIDFCRTLDRKVQSNTGAGYVFKKKYLGILVSVENINYYVPLSSYKDHKHDRMSESIDFIKIEEIVEVKDAHGTIVNTRHEKYAVLNLNNMIPVPEQALIEIDINNLPNNTDAERKYIDLLRNEWNICRLKKEKIRKNASRLLNIVKKGNNIKIIQRCCDFSLLEGKMNEYI